MPRHKQQHETPEQPAIADVLSHKPGSPDWYRTAYPEEIAAYRRAEAQRQAQDAG
jgi:hypothetical protein